MHKCIHTLKHNCMNKYIYAYMHTYVSTSVLLYLNTIGGSVSNASMKFTYTFRPQCFIVVKLRVRSGMSYRNEASGPVGNTP